MKFNIAKDPFLKVLHKVQSVIPVHSTQPVLFNILIICEKDKITLTATDTYITMECTVEADIKKKGASTIPARRLFSIVRELPEQQIEVEVDDKSVAHIRCGASSYKIYGLPAEEFPTSDSFKKDNKGVVIDQGIFKDMLKKTAYAVSNEESRPILNGVYMMLKDQKMTIVATDGRRLALIEHETEIVKDSENSVILPTKAVNEIIKSMPDEGNMKIQLEPKRVAFNAEDTKLTAKLIEGEYPDYQQVIPGSFDERITVERESFLAVLRRVSLLTNDKFPSVKITFTENQVAVSSSTPDVGEANESIPVKYSGKNITAAFNPEFLMDPLRNLTNDEVFLEIVDDISPVVIKCDIPFLYVVMPLRVD